MSWAMFRTPLSHLPKQLASVTRPLRSLCIVKLTLFFKIESSMSQTYVRHLDMLGIDNKKNIWPCEYCMVSYVFNLLSWPLPFSLYGSDNKKKPQCFTLSLTHTRYTRDSLDRMLEIMRNPLPHFDYSLSQTQSHTYTHAINEYSLKMGRYLMDLHWKTHTHTQTQFPLPLVWKSKFWPVAC